MGIFDASTYAPAQSGLIDRLMASLGAPLDPGPGFPQSPMDANAAMPQQVPAQNAPIAIGNYMMPRIGSGFAPLPDGSLPRQTADEQDAGVLPGNLPAQPQAVAPSPQTKNVASQPDNPLLRMARGLHSVARGGSLYGAITGNYDDPQSFLQQQKANAIQQQYLALKAAGVPDKYAVLAAINPEAAKSIVPQYVGPDKNKFLKIGQDGLGREQYGFVNEQDKTVTPASSPGGADTSSGLGDMSKTGAAYLATLPPAQRGIVQAMLDGRQAPPSSFALGKPYWQNMISAANNVDPTFDQTSWPARVAGMKSFRSGADAGTVRSANQVLGHISDLADKADALGNGSYPSLNYVKNTFDSQTGSDAANNWVTQAHAVADELSTFMKGAGHSSDTEIKQWLDSLSPNMSPQQQRGAVQTLMGIYDHALSALEDKRTGAVGSMAAEKMGPLLTPAGQAAKVKILNWANANAGNGGTATTRTGVKWSVE